jgi:hypothetical protein
MRRALRDTLILAGAPAALALAVLVLGGTLRRTSPAETHSALAPDSLWPASECHTTTVVPARGSGVAGGALLCIAVDAVRPAIYASGLTPGAAYSAWMLSFDRLPDRRPEALADDIPFGSERANASGRLGSGVASYDGAIHLQGHFDDRPLPSGSRVTLLLIDDGVSSERGSRLGSVVAYARFTLS